MVVQPPICTSGGAFPLFTHQVHACDCAAPAVPPVKVPAATAAATAAMRRLRPCENLWSWYAPAAFGPSPRQPGAAGESNRRPPAIPPPDASSSPTPR